MKSIPVGPHHQAIVDDEDFEELARHRWYLTNGRYAIRHARKSDGKRAVVKMHIQIIGHPPFGKVTDHIDGNGLNNQRNNLRHITYRANTQNRFSFMSSRFPGISWDKKRNCWLAQITINGKRKYLGRFPSEGEAFEAYKNQVIMLGDHVIIRDWRTP